MLYNGASGKQRLVDFPRPATGGETTLTRDRTAGVCDRATNRKITAPADTGPVRLADGFLLRENRTTHDLLLTDFHTGTATTRTLVKLPATDQNTGGSNGRWAVDRFGGHIAYLNGTYGEVSIVPSGVPTSPLAQMEAQVYSPSVIGWSMPWSPVWQLNKPSFAP